jgi:hypothetical protein
MPLTVSKEMYQKVCLLAAIIGDLEVQLKGRIA